LNGTRRTFLGYGLAAAAAAPLAGLYPRIAQAATRLAVTPLAGRLSLITGGAANMVVAAAGDELLLVDGGAEADAKALQKLLAAL